MITGRQFTGIYQLYQTLLEFRSSRAGNPRSHVQTSATIRSPGPGNPRSRYHTSRLELLPGYHGLATHGHIRTNFSICLGIRLSRAGNPRSHAHKLQQLSVYHGLATHDHTCRLQQSSGHHGLATHGQINRYGPHQFEIIRSLRVGNPRQPGTISLSRAGNPH